MPHEVIDQCRQSESRAAGRLRRQAAPVMPGTVLTSSTQTRPSAIDDQIDAGQARSAQRLRPRPVRTRTISSRSLAFNSKSN